MGLQASVPTLRRVQLRHRREPRLSPQELQLLRLELRLLCPLALYTATRSLQSGQSSVPPLDPSVDPSP